MISRHFQPAVCIAFVLTLGGCSVEPEQIEQWSESLRKSGGFTAPSEIKQTPQSLVSEVRFRPKYEERVDPFHFPNDQPTTVVKRDSRASKATQLEVLGFAQLDVPKVILRTKDSTVTLAVGQSHYGLEVIEIQPPAVKLKSGNLVWTATMFDPTVSEN
ncbi:hypothetical protein SH528x_000299 [Novipirellula sp. SH528]|uniref:hypothetical protein n=1 Tax=Novipirellula sp. SH528 TaxID=3454466 RepID=UPI003FA10FA1